MSLMTPRQSLEYWAAELDKQLGWNVNVSADGSCGFQTKEGLIVAVEANDDLNVVVFHAAVGEVADLEDPILLRGLLECNWFGRSTGPGQLGLEPGGNKLVLFMPWLEGASATSEQFASVLQRFTAIAAELKSRIDQGTIRSDGAAVGAQSTSFDGFTRV